MTVGRGEVENRREAMFVRCGTEAAREYVAAVEAHPDQRIESHRRISAALCVIAVLIAAVVLGWQLLGDLSRGAVIVACVPAAVVNCGRLVLASRDLTLRLRAPEDTLADVRGAEQAH